MDTSYPPHPLGYLSGTSFVESLHMAQYPSPEEEMQHFDMPLHAEYETPWLTFEEGSTPPSSSPEAHYQDANSPSRSMSSSHTRKSTSIKPRDPEISRRNRRRAQNRQSQRQFRERKQQAYDQVVSQLQAQDALISSLRAENARLEARIQGLKRENKGQLDAVVRFVRGLSSAVEDGAEVGMGVGCGLAGGWIGKGMTGDTVGLREVEEEEEVRGGGFREG